MDGLFTLALLAGGGFLAYKAFNPTKPAAAQNGSVGAGADCLSAADCKALSDCAGKLLPTAKASDLPTLGKILSKANDLGCTDVQKQVQATINSLSTTVIATGPAGGPGAILTGTGSGGTDPSPGKTAAGYTLVQNDGTVSSAAPGDVLIVAIQKTDKTYVIPLSYSGSEGASAGPASFNNTISDVALAKAKAQPGFAAATAALGIFGVTFGAPSDLPNGTSFNVNFSSSSGAGDVLAIITAKQLSSDVTGEGISEFGRQDQANANVGQTMASHFGPKPKGKSRIWDRGIGG